MTAAVARTAAEHDHHLLPTYLEHVAALGLSDRSLRDRLRSARVLFGEHPNLETWMARPVQERLATLDRTHAWPLVVFAIGAGHLRLDVELMVAKNLTGLASIVQDRHREDFVRAREAGLRLGWTPDWVRTVLQECLAVLLAWHGGTLDDLDETVLDHFASALSSTADLPPTSLRAYRTRLASLRQILFELRVIDTVPQRGRRGASLEQRFAVVPMAEQIRVSLLRYVTLRSTVLRPKSIESLINDLLPFAEFLHAQHPEVTALALLERRHLEAFLLHNRTRPWRGRRAHGKGAGRTISPAVMHSTVLTVRNLLDDITAWDWTDAPRRRLLFAADVPKLEQPLPRALAPDVDSALMAAIAACPDPFVRTGLQVLRGAGLRVGELLDLELSAVVDYGAAGSWLKVPLGKLATERMVPLDAATMTVLDTWAAERGAHRPLTHPRTGKQTDFLFTAHGRRLGATRLRVGLLTAAKQAGLTGPGGAPLIITCHQLRHTYATSLANAGMSLQALMALLGHVTPQMTIRYATLASPTLRTAYDQAIGSIRTQLTLTPVGRPIVPDKVNWLAAEMLKTRVAHGYCSRHAAGEACPYANICETCDNYTPAVEFIPALTDQLADVHALQTDAQQRGWSSENDRHGRVAAALQGHLLRLDKQPAQRPR